MMAQNDDELEPTMGRSRRQSSVRPSPSRTKLMQSVARSGGNPRALSSAVPQPKRAPSGRYNARGRGAKVAASIPRETGWSLDRGTGSRVRTRRVTVKARYVTAAGKGAGRAHLSYLERDGVTREGERGRLYSTFSDEADRDAFLDRGVDDKHQFRFIIAPEDAALYSDLKPFTRDLMAKVEADLGTTLDWVAVDHHDTGHPHVHVIVRGVTEDGKTLNIAGDYIAHGIRHRASEVATHDLGLQSERELQQQLEHEVGAERLTRLDRALLGRAENSVADLRNFGTNEGDRAHQQLLIARARQLERMGLAKQNAPLCWSLEPRAEPTLRAMGERGDIIKTMHRALQRTKAERSPELYVVHDQLPLKSPIIGRVVGRGLADDLGESRYAVLDSVDGRTHYVEIGTADHSLPIGSVVSVSNTPTSARQVDRTVAEVAAANGGCYSEGAHWLRDHNASASFIQTHVRRLEAIRRETGGVDRLEDGTWRIAPDHLDRAAAYEKRLAADRPVTVQTLSTAPLQQQIGADAPTWLDRQIVRELKHDLAETGFGRDVRGALAQRRQWLLDQGLARQDGEGFTAPTDLLPQLRSRELTRAAGQLSRELGLQFTETLPGDRVDGVYKRPVDLVGGRYALVQRSLDFTLVPWRPVLEKQIGREVSGRAVGDSIDWSFGRQRGGPAL